MTKQDFEEVLEKIQKDSLDRFESSIQNFKERISADIKNTGEQILNGNRQNNSGIAPVST